MQALLRSILSAVENSPELRNILVQLIVENAPRVVDELLKAAGQALAPKSGQTSVQ